MRRIYAKALMRMPEMIVSRANARVKAVRELQHRKARHARHETIIEGPTVFGEFIKADTVPSMVLCTAEDTLTLERCLNLGIEPALVSGDVLASVSDTRSPRSPVAVISVAQPNTLRTHNTLVLVDIADPGNVGTMIRTAAALGWDVAASGATAELWAPKTIRSSAGTHVHTRLIELSDPIQECAAAGLITAATVVAGADQPTHRTTPVALLVGSESHGLPADIVDRSDVQMTIAMPGGTESLNAAVAASLAMYALSALDV